MKNKEELFDEWAQAVEDMAAQDKIDAAENRNIMRISQVNYKEINKVLDFCDLNGVMSIVDHPRGTLQKGERTKNMLKIWIDQWSVGTEGDTYEGDIYGQLHVEDKYIKIPYRC